MRNMFIGSIVFYISCFVIFSCHIDHSLCANSDIDVDIADESEWYIVEESDTVSSTKTLAASKDSTQRHVSDVTANRAISPPLHVTAHKITAIQEGDDPREDPSSDDHTTPTSGANASEEVLKDVELWDGSDGSVSDEVSDLKASVVLESHKAATPKNTKRPTLEEESVEDRRDVHELGMASYEPPTLSTTNFSNAHKKPHELEGMSLHTDSSTEGSEIEKPPLKQAAKPYSIKSLSDHMMDVILKYYSSVSNEGLPLKKDLEQFIKVFKGALAYSANLVKLSNPKCALSPITYDIIMQIQCCTLILLQNILLNPKILSKCCLVEVGYDFEKAFRLNRAVYAYLLSDQSSGPVDIIPARDSASTTLQSGLVEIAHVSDARRSCGTLDRFLVEFPIKVTHEKDLTYYSKVFMPALAGMPHTKHSRLGLYNSEFHSLSTLLLASIYDYFCLYTLPDLSTFVRDLANYFAINLSAYTEFVARLPRPEWEIWLENIAATFSKWINSFSTKKESTATIKDGMEIELDSRTDRVGGLEVRSSTLVDISATHTQGASRLRHQSEYDASENSSCATLEVA
jgi:hypothetical protein